MRIMYYPSINVYDKEKDKTIQIKTGDTVYILEGTTYIEFELVDAESVCDIYDGSRISTNYYAIIHRYDGRTEKVLINDLYIIRNNDVCSYYEKISEAKIIFNPVILDDYGDIIFIKDTCEIGVVCPSCIDNIYWIDGIIKDIDTNFNINKVIISINNNDIIEICENASHKYLIRKCDIYKGGHKNE